MPVSYTIDARVGVVFSRRWGVLTDGELCANSWALAHDAQFEPTFRLLADLRDVVRFDLSPIGVRALAELNPFSRKARRAGVMASDESSAVLRMYRSSLLGSSEEFLVCRSINEALEWLGLDANTPWPVGSPTFIVDRSPVGVTALGAGT